MSAAATDRGICFLEYCDRKNFDAQLDDLLKGLGEGAEVCRSKYIDDLELQLDEYFSGHRKSFSVPVWSPSSSFYSNVWRELRGISYGETSAYSNIATNIHKPEAVRAVATAIGRNRVAILTPCHRVILRSGKVGQYAGGPQRKIKLLELENRFS